MPSARVSPSRSHSSSSGSGQPGGGSPALTGGCADASSSVYARSVRALQTNEQWLKEVATGSRVGFYRLKNEIGNGNFSQVKLAYHQLTKERVAVKIVDKTKLDGKTQRMVVREVGVMASLQHPHIVRLYEVVETLTKLHLVLEHAPGGELFARISADGRLAEPDAAAVFAQLVSAVRYMHGKNIIHRDLKAENVFFSGPRSVKVGDFGFSVQLRSCDHLLDTFCGSPPYAAPELFRDEHYVGPPVDVWALGVLLYFMVTGSMPFRAPTVPSLKRLILDGRFPLPPHLPPALVAVLTGTLQQAPRHRLTLDQLADSDWLRPHRSPPQRPRSAASLASAKELDQRIKGRLRQLGIDGAKLREAAAGGRAMHNPVLGTYRIVAHRIQRESAKEDGCAVAALPTLSTATVKPNTGSNGYPNSNNNEGGHRRFGRHFRFVVKPFHFLKGKSGKGKNKRDTAGSPARQRPRSGVPSDTEPHTSKLCVIL